VDSDDLRPRDHPKKEVREALHDIMDSGRWRLYKAGHWGRLDCETGCCSIAVSGTPRDAATHARQLRSQARQHPRDVGDPRNRRRG
jgi:hypothetical protein